MTKAQIQDYIMTLGKVAEIIGRIERLATDRQGRWASDSEVLSLRTNIEQFSDHQSVKLHISLHHFFEGHLDSEEEKAERLEVEGQTKALALAVVREFGVQARRKNTESPGTLTLKLSDSVELEISGYPTAVKFSCEKHCVAVLPNGNKVELQDVPVED